MMMIVCEDWGDNVMAMRMTVYENEEDDVMRMTVYED